MTKGRLNHIQLNVGGEQSIQFYRDLLGYFEYKSLLDLGHFCGLSDGSVSVWVGEAPDKPDYNRDSIGLNHFGLHVDSSSDVDAFVSEFLQPRGVQPILDSPRHRPDFRPSPGDYYQVLFTDPDGLLIEVYHTE
jgi:catechol 2,3-dioxygenase-like lactoylglutathione lyase family enzyme